MGVFTELGGGSGSGQGIGFERLVEDEKTEKLIAKKMALHEEIRQHFAKELEELAIEGAGQMDLFK